MPEVQASPEVETVTRVMCDCGHESDVITATPVTPVIWRSPDLLICPTCLDANHFQCDDCDDWFNNAFVNNGPEGSLICNSCMDSYFCCSDCRVVMHVDNDAGGGVCTECYREDENVELIREYSYRPSPKFFGEGPHYMGVELETEVVRGELDESAQKTLDLLGSDFVYLKRDGSINNGFEIVSHPASLKHHRDTWEKFFDERPRGLRSADVDNCGLHIHTSRNCLSDLTIGKMLAFVNCASNAKFIKAVARRESRDYARLDPRKKVSSVKNQYPERYEAINLIPKHTIEFRLFKGTLNKTSFFIALEFVQCLIDFCKPSNHGISECVGTDAFFKFVARLHRKKPISDEKIAKYGIDRKVLEKRTGSASHPYPNLAKFCADFAAKESEKKA